VKFHRRFVIHRANEPDHRRTDGLTDGPNTECILRLIASSGTKHVTGINLGTELVSFCLPSGNHAVNEDVRGGEGGMPHTPRQYQLGNFAVQIT